MMILWSMEIKLTTRHLDELTSREVERYVQAGGDLVLVPFGPLSGHGALIPLGIHAHWAHALSLLVAERAGGLVYPPVFACYAGATRSFRGTGPFSIMDQAMILKKIAIGLGRQGFKRVVLVAATTPEYIGGTVAAREVFDETEKPVWLLIADKLLEAPEVKEMYARYPGQFGETLIELASLKVLGKNPVIRYPEWARMVKPPEPDQPGEITADVHALRKWGTIGFRYHAEGEHGNHGNAGIVHEGELDVDLAGRVLAKCADLVVLALSSYARYAEWVARSPFTFIVPADLP
jgi:creatinine amidohydrolase/Fe(II)-dependent formamide hydrolase-like protein